MKSIHFSIQPIIIFVYSYSHEIINGQKPKQYKTKLVAFTQSNAIVLNLDASNLVNTNFKSPIFFWEATSTSLIQLTSWAHSCFSHGLRNILTIFFSLCFPHFNRVSVAIDLNKVRKPNQKSMELINSAISFLGITRLL